MSSVKSGGKPYVEYMSQISLPAFLKKKERKRKRENSWFNLINKNNQTREIFFYQQFLAIVGFKFIKYFSELRNTIERKWKLLFCNDTVKTYAFCAILKRAHEQLCVRSDKI